MSPAIRPAAATRTGARTDPVPSRHAWAVQTLLDAGADADRQDDHRRGLARHPRREPVRGHADQPARAGAGAGRLVGRLGGGGRGRALRHRARHRYRRLGAGAGELLRALRHPPDAWPARPDRHDGAGAELGHDRLVRRATPRPSPGSRRSCSARRSRTHCRGGWSSRATPSRSPIRKPQPRCEPMVARLRRLVGEVREEAMAPPGLGDLGAGAAHVAALRGVADLSGLDRARQSALPVQRRAQPGARRA